MLSSFNENKSMDKILTFRVVPEYFKEIEKVAKVRKIPVSKLIRVYIREGLKRDRELSSKEEVMLSKDTNMF